MAGYHHAVPALLLILCSSNAQVNPAEHQEFADALTPLLYEKPNECSSALGVSMAFSLIYPGSTNDGITEIEDTFNYPGGDIMKLVWEETTVRLLGGASGQCVDEFNGECYAYAPMLMIANSVWLNSSDTLQEDYAEIVGEYAMQTDFSSPDSPTEVNNWVNSSTNGLIDEIVDPSKPLYPSDVLLAINSIYLKARWSEQFQEGVTNTDNFYGEASRTTEVGKAHFMHIVEYFGYSHNALDGYQIINLGFDQSSMSMIFVLPLNDAAAAVASTELIDALDELQSTRVALALPKFKFESEYSDSLVAALNTLGLNAPFEEGTDSLCGLLENYDCAKLIITKVVQKTVIDVNEKGVEAAAVTAIGVGVTSAGPPPEDPVLMVLDHPFQFFIYDNEEELMLFEGRVGAPEAPEEQAASEADHDNIWTTNFGVTPVEPSALGATSSTAATQESGSSPGATSTNAGTTNPADKCLEISTCAECLDAKECGHWAVGECMASCAEMDVSCYATEYFEDMSADEICAKAESDDMDGALCGSMEDCASCVEAVKNDGESTCMWFELGYCGTGCDMNGCGTIDATECPAITLAASTTSAASNTLSTEAPEGCAAITTCAECLDAKECGYWTVGECMESCAVADASCYATEYFEDMSADEICTEAENDNLDEALCGNMEDCSSCVGAIKNDGESTCMWFDNLGYCGTGCGMNGCGMTNSAECPAITMTATNAVETVEASEEIEEEVEESMSMMSMSAPASTSAAPETTQTDSDSTSSSTESDENSSGHFPATRSNIIISASFLFFAAHAL